MYVPVWLLLLAGGALLAVLWSAFGVLWRWIACLKACYLELADWGEATIVDAREQILDGQGESAIPPVLVDAKASWTLKVQEHFRLMRQAGVPKFTDDDRMYRVRSALGEVRKHPAYTEREWRRDERRRLGGTKLPCPDCGSAENYGPRKHSHADGSERHYRACKVCGFWQEADGSPAYRAWLAVHRCVQPLRAGQDVGVCRVCGAGFAVQEPSKGWEHECGRYLTPWERGFDCTNCGRFIDRSFARALPSGGSGA